jgi:hypothetical protein
VSTYSTAIPKYGEEVLRRAVREILREELAPIREETVKVLDDVVISAGGLTEFAVLSSSRHSALILTVKATYSPSATSGVRVRWLYSPDSVNFDSVEDAEAAGNYEDLSFSPGTTRQRTLVIPLLQPHVKIQVVNRDPFHPVTVSCWRTMVR